MNIKISIIVPVYNTETYLKQCIESIIKQNYTNWELILIDDGSSDSSPIICDEYSNKDKRIQVIHKKNEGVSKARNSGLDISRGEYITFADSDDYLSPDTFQTYINEIGLNNPDIIKVGYIKEYENNTNEVISINKNAVFYNTWDFHRALENSHYYSFLWNMCIKKECIGKIRFDNNINWLEDHIFSYQCYFNCKRMSILNKTCYHYRIRSINNLSNIKNPFVIIEAAEKERYWKNRLNSKIYLDIQEETNNQYAYHMHTIVNLLYQNNYSYNEKRRIAKKTQTNLKLKYKEESIFFFQHLPFFIRNFLLTILYTYKSYSSNKKNKCHYD